MAPSTTITLSVLNDTDDPVRVELEYVRTGGSFAQAFPDGKIVPPNSTAQIITVDLSDADTSKKYTVTLGDKRESHVFAATNELTLKASEDAGTCTDSTLLVALVCAGLFITSVFLLFAWHRGLLKNLMFWNSSGDMTQPAVSPAGSAATEIIAPDAYTGIYQ